MLQALMTAFLSFAVIASPYGAVMPMQANSSYNIENVSYEEVEVDMYWRWFIGTHVMVQIEKVEPMGYQCIDKLSRNYSGSGLENFTFREKFTTVTSTTISTTKSFSSKISTGLQVAAKIPNAQITGDAKIEQVYTISNTSTYTATESTEFEVEFSVKQEVVNGKIFALCMAADVYKVTWDTWEWEDTWWGDYELEGTRQTNIAYITVDPFVTIVFSDGSVVV